MPNDDLCSGNGSLSNQWCRIHSEEPCGPTCNEYCEEGAHQTPADGGWHPDYGYLCGECIEAIWSSEGAERHNAAKYAYACGYQD